MRVWRTSRTVTSTFDFTPQKTNLLRYNPTVYYIQPELDELVEKFLADDSDEDKLFYIWGHSYELDADMITWEHFEEVCKKLSGHADIFYGTNKEVFL